MLTIATHFLSGADPLVWFAHRLLPHLLQVADIDALPLFPPCPGGGVVCGKIGGPLRCLMAFIDRTRLSSCAARRQLLLSGVLFPETSEGGGSMQKLLRQAAQRFSYLVYFSPIYFI